MMTPVEWAATVAVGIIALTLVYAVGAGVTARLLHMPDGVCAGAERLEGGMRLGDGMCRGPSAPPWSRCDYCSKVRYRQDSIHIWPVIWAGAVVITVVRTLIYPARVMYRVTAGENKEE